MRKTYIHHNFGSRFIWLILALLNYNAVLAQNSTINGVVQAPDKSNLSGASVRISNINNLQQGFTTVTNKNGDYIFTNIAAGYYLITATYTGYMPYVSDTLHITQAQNIVQNFILQLQPQSLNEVVVTAKVPPVVIDKGKLVVKLNNSSITAGQTAFDMLRKLPGITIDQNENLLMKGAAGVNVMIDDRMVYLTGSQLSNYLKGLSAETLNRIELINTPTAEFDAAGTAGIIKIVLNQPKSSGYAADIRTGVSKSKYWMTNSNVSASFRDKKWSINALFDYNTPHRYYDKESGNNLPGQEEVYRLTRTQQTIFKIKYYT